MENFRNTCECCNKGYNFGNPYLCDDCITEDYYEEEMTFNDEDHSSIYDSEIIIKTI